MRAYDRFRQIASSPDFLRRFRARHALSSPRSFLGVFTQRCPVGLPVFHLAEPARSDPGLVVIARTSDFLLAGLEEDPAAAWRFHDCRNGRLLLSKGKSSLTIYDPISFRRIDVSRPRDDPFPDGYIYINCLLDDGDAPFRLVSLQVDDRRRLRAAEYDSRVQEWRFHPWAAAAIKAPLAYYQTMYAAELIFWNHDRLTEGASSLLLDTRTMEFTMLPLPATFVKPYGMASRYSIGETEDGRCCLVCVSKSNQTMQVWLLRENRGGARKWEFEKEKPFRELLSTYCGGFHVGKVVAGLAIVWAADFQYYALDLKDLSLKATFSNLGPTTAYPFQLPWPPAGLTPAKRHKLQIDTLKGMYV
jgi:hypothetical protein